MSGGQIAVDEGASRGYNRPVIMLKLALMYPQCHGGNDCACFIISVLAYSCVYEPCHNNVSRQVPEDFTLYVDSAEVQIKFAANGFRYSKVKKEHDTAWREEAKTTPFGANDHVGMLLDVKHSTVGLFINGLLACSYRIQVPQDPTPRYTLGVQLSKEWDACKLKTRYCWHEYDRE